ncbi:hypothetical protein RNP03_21390, partial [Escherichia coli]|nr:hypothetical protein [Escherichia coli]
MRDLQTSGIVGLSASKMGCKHSDRHGEVNDKKNVAVLPTVSASIRATKGSTGGYTYQGNKVVFVGNDSNLLIVFYVQIMPDDLVMQLHR